MGLKIQVHLPDDRSKTGTLTLIDPITGASLFGPIPVLGRAARNIAAQNGNPRADALFPYGDTPLGDYVVAMVVANGPGTSRPTVQYGQSGAIVLTPSGGDALTAQRNGRTGLLIHSGRHAYSSLVPATALKSTNGCLRALDWDLGQLIDVLRAQQLVFPGAVTIEVGREGPAGDTDEDIDDGDPPTTDGTPVLP